MRSDTEYGISVIRWVSLESESKYDGDEEPNLINLSLGVWRIKLRMSYAWNLHYPERELARGEFFVHLALHTCTLAAAMR